MKRYTDRKRAEVDELSKKIQNSKSGQRKITMKQKIFVISTMSCKNPWDKEP